MFIQAPFFTYATTEMKLIGKAWIENQFNCVLS